MLRLMRDKASNWLIKVLLGAIVVVFVFWGVGSFRAQRVGRVALVNGEQITLDEYRQTYNNLIEQLRQTYQNNLTEDMIKTLQVRKQAMGQLVDKKLLVQEARRLKFEISDQELADAITKIGAFQTAGIFNSRLYQNILNRLRMTPEEFEITQREAMLIEKLRAFIAGSVKVSDQESRAFFDWANASVSIDFVLFDPGSYEDINPSQEEVKAFFEKNKENYRTDPLVKVRYLYFDPETYIPEVSVSDEEIQYYYNENQEEFKTPKTVEARHILLKVDDNAEPETVEKTENKALNVLKLAREGKDFAELAKQYSEGPTKDKGGYLGTFKKETMVKPFADKAFSMKAGEISEPVRTRFGWHIIKVEKVNEASFLSLDEAKEKIEKKISAEEAKSLAYDEADVVSDISFEGDDLLQAAKEHNLKVLTTDFFTRKGPEKGIIDRNEFASAAFGLLDMEISDTQDFKDGYYILQVTDRIPAKIPEIEKVKDAVLADLIKEKQNEKANEDANAFLSGLKSGRSMSEESKKYNLSSTTTGFFKRNGPIPEIGREVTISQAVFKLSSEKILPEKAIRGSKGYYVIQFNDRKAPEDEAFSKEKEKTVQNLLLQKQSRAFNALLAQLKNTGEISIKEGFLE